MKILLFGSNGQVGRELCRTLLPLGEVMAFDRRGANFENPANIRSIISKHKAKVIVNATAYTAVDSAENNQDTAHQVNAESVKILAQECKKIGAWLVHYSTDYIFDGTKTEAYIEEDKPNPLSVYGKTKLLGEQAIVESGCNYVIFRTSWVYGSHGSNFAKTMIRLAQERDTLNVVVDQVGVPTSAAMIADVTTLCLHQLLTEKYSGKNNKSGVYNLTPIGKTNWHEFAQFVISESIKHGCKFQILPEDINPITTKDYPTPAARPANSQLSTKKLANTFDIVLPHWQKHVLLLINDLMNEKNR